MTKIEKIIRQAVSEGIEAGRRQAEQSTKNAYRETERRLYALPDLKDKIEKDKAYLEDFKKYGPSGRSADIIRFQKSGVRLSEEDIKSAIIQDYTARIAANEFEIKTVEEALAPLTRDTYFLALSGKYFKNFSDEIIADRLHCDPRTVRRNRGRLVSRTAVRLYGVDAL